MSGFTYNSPENMLSVARKSNNFYQIQECVKTIREAVSVGKTSFEVLSTSDEELTQLLRDRLMKDAAPHIAAGNLKVAGNILRQGGYTLQDAGVTEEEYQTYLVQVASNQLERVRHPQIQRDNSINSGHGLLPSFLLEFLREALEEAKVSLEDIDSSEEELRALWRDANAQAARVTIELIREGKASSLSVVPHLRDYLTTARISLSDIGSSEEELRALWQPVCRKRAGSILTDVRKGVNNPRYQTGLILKYLEQGDLSPSDIASTSEELEHFRKMKDRMGVR